MKVIDYYSKLEDTLGTLEPENAMIVALEMFTNEMRQKIYAKQVTETSKHGAANIGGLASGMNYELQQEAKAAAIVRAVVKEEVQVLYNELKDGYRARAEDDGVVYDE